MPAPNLTVAESKAKLITKLNDIIPASDCTIEVVENSYNVHILVTTPAGAKVKLASPGKSLKQLRALVKNADEILVGSGLFKWRIS